MTDRKPVVVHGGALFRQAALEYQLSADLSAPVTRVTTPANWLALAIAGGALVAALILAVAGRVEVVSRGRAVIRSAAGVRTVSAPVSGSIARIDAKSGGRVRRGEPLALLESAQSEPALRAAEQRLAELSNAGRDTERQQETLHAEQVAMLDKRLRLLRDEEASHVRSHELALERERSVRELSSAGLAPKLEVNTAAESVESTRRQLAGIRAVRIRAEQELASLTADRERAAWTRRRELHDAQSRYDELRSALRQLRVVAPVDGTIDASFVRPGDVVSSGEPLVRIVPTDANLTVVAFVPEKDAAFIRAGDTAWLELDQYRAGEFGKVRATVLAVARELASAREIRREFGEEAAVDVPLYRVELRPEAAPAGVRLRSGMLATSVFTVRKVRPIALVAKWLAPDASP